MVVMSPRLQVAVKAASLRVVVFFMVSGGVRAGEVVVGAAVGVAGGGEVGVGGAGEAAVGELCRGYRMVRPWVEAVTKKEFVSMNTWFSLTSGRSGRR